MAGRGCGCAGGSCSCSVIAGSGATVSGIGTASDPYVVSAVLDELAGSLTFTDGATVNFTVTGQGTPTDPMNITAEIVTPNAVALPVYATGSRPSASSVGAGKMIYNSTTTRPNFSDGTNWRDAAGTIV